MSFKEFRATCTQEWAPLLSDYLMDVGALSVTYLDAEDHPIFEPERNQVVVWPKTCVHALFSSDTANVLPLVYEKFPELKKKLTDIAWLDIQDKAWEREWMDQFFPLDFGNNLWIVPSHHVPPEPNAINILLDPGLAFGTGTHETTRLCLEWLGAHPPQHQTVIDYGCGSGILAIAAQKLGAVTVWALDIDEQALIATQNNAERNALPEGAIQCTMVPEAISNQADLLLANILAGPLAELHDTFNKLLRSGGTLVLSGILKEQGPALIAHYENTFHFCDETQLGDWIRLVFIKK